MFLLFPSEPTDSKTLETSLQQAMGRTGSSHRSGLEVSMSLLKMRQRETSRAHSVSRTCGVTISPAPPGAQTGRRRPWGSRVGILPDFPEEVLTLLQGAWVTEETEAGPIPKRHRTPLWPAPPHLLASRADL